MEPTVNNLIAEAREWLGTKYHHQASVKGVGADCVGFLKGAAVNVGLISLEEASAYPTDYSRQPSGGMLRRLVGQNLVQVPFEERRPGDLGLMRFQSDEQHLFMFTSVDPDYIIHAAQQGVVEHRFDFQTMRQQTARVYRFPRLLSITPQPKVSKRIGQALPDKGARKFIISGLPRSRSAWLAAFLTDGPVFCHHELIRHCDSPHEYSVRLQDTRQPVKGDSDTLLPMFYPALRDKLQDVRFAFIRRDPAEVIASAVKAGAALGLTGIPGEKVIPATLLEGLRMMREDHPDSPEWAFEELEDVGAVRDLHQYCTGRPWDLPRFQLFHPLRVDTIYQKTFPCRLLGDRFPTPEALSEAIRFELEGGK